MTLPIHQTLADRELLPSVHLLDAGYVDAAIVVNSRSEHGIEVIGPVLTDTSWQAMAGQGFDISAFTIDWETQQVTCPQGQTSRDWTLRQDSFGNECVDIRFDQEGCAACSKRSLCTRSKTRPREIMLRPRPQHELLQERRQQQKTEAWCARYGKRAGIEGTLSQGVRSFGLRRSRYIGLIKTHLQHVFIALAINVVRIEAWLTERPLARTRQSAFSKLQLIAA